MTGLNWAGNLRYAASEFAAPATVAEAQEIVRRAPKLRALGSRHCFNTLADTPALHVSLEKQRRILDVDTAAGTVTVEGGIRYGDLAPALHAAGHALHNLASLPHISVAGAIATATHGSGVRLGSLATAVTALEFIRADGELVTLTRDKDGDTFAGAVVHLGALGVITRLTLKIEPAFAVRQDVWLDLPLAALTANFDAVMSAGYSVSLFTTWQGDSIDQVWIKSRADAPAPPPSDLHGARLATTKMHPIASVDPAACTEQQGAAGAWHDRLPHFRMDFTPSSGAELQAEYYVPRERAAEGVRILKRWGRALGPFMLISEVRTIAADDLWLSPAYQRDVVAFHFTLKQDPSVPRLLYELEAQLAPLEPVPHWGKLFSLAPAKVRAAFPRLADFRALAARHDPQGKFRNAFVEKYVFGETASA
ncbi:MAG TPA: FAD-binding protein [Bauldia sp.]|nr:FAD-binding protein [Bauldia sp.]